MNVEPLGLAMSTLHVGAVKNASWLDRRKEPRRVETVSGTNERHDLDNGFGASAGRLHCVCMRQVRKCEGPLCLKLPFDMPPPPFRSLSFSPGWRETHQPGHYTLNRLGLLHHTGN